MNNPVESLVKWLKSLSVEQQNEIALLISNVHPSFNTPCLFAGNTTAKQFYTLLQSSTTGTYKNLGMIIAFRAIFDFLFYAKRSAKEKWSDAARELYNVINDNSKDDFRSCTHQQSDETCRRIMEWVSVCDAWLELKEGPLSDESLGKWHYSTVAGFIL
ncbi:hypothetical protein [Trabulsiella odontotermitis]|uniref:hypothetical protein n=1 Tax=Trabulsiella odontotermitis TaxID=379893 RepID=UPI0006761545|nr:hypothetical protein [Trabulsiella odontotermitis]KNC92581.1 hypothetical protein GM30_15920 [Trabulsiella odontotermitis]